MAHNKCDVCGVEEWLPFKCSRCGGTFCGNHRLPEYHNCKNFDKQQDIPVSQKINVTSSKNMSPFKTYNYTPEQINRPKKKSSVSIYKIKRKLKKFVSNLLSTIIGIIAIIVTITFIGVIFLGSNAVPAANWMMNTVLQPPIYQNYIDTAYPNSTTCSVTEYRNATNPSYNELINFLKNDNTEQGLYVPNQHVCINFAIELHDNAERNHINAHVFSIQFTDGERHAYDGFNTTDRGWIYIDDTGFTAAQKAIGGPDFDGVVNPVFGSSYIRYPLFPLPGNWIASQESMGTVSSIEQLC